MLFQREYYIYHFNFVSCCQPQIIIVKIKWPWKFLHLRYVYNCRQCLTQIIIVTLSRDRFYHVEQLQHQTITCISHQGAPSHMHEISLEWLWSRQKRIQSPTQYSLYSQKHWQLRQKYHLRHTHGFILLDLLNPVYNYILI